MGVRRWLLEPETGPGGLEWPRWAPLTLLTCWLATAVGALLQRDALFPPRTAALLALLALAPELVECVLGRTPPRPVFAALVIVGAVGLLVDPAYGDVAPFLFILLAVEVAATSSLAAAGGTVLAGSAVMVVLGMAGAYDGWWLWVPGIAAGGVAGYAVQTQVRLLQQERATRAALAERLAAEDRQRVAREVHDVIAHSLGVTMLHLTAARHALESDPEEAEIDEAVDSLRAAERVGRQAMGDIRRTIGLLDGPSGAAVPAPGLDDLPRLVDEFRVAGIDVSYELRGELAGLSPAAGLDLYRVAEESLANVVKHAPGGCADVLVDASGRDVRLLVRSRPPSRAAAPAGGGNGASGGDGAQAGGRGIRGMRERVELQGGTLRTGPEDVGWCVEASFPRTAQ
jgi:signal transduction histidine kinase